jgi:hypothetical protein
MDEREFQKRIEAVRLRGEKAIREYGYMVQGVFGGTGSSFSYTIGLHAKHKAELIVIGVSPEVGHDLLNDVAQLLLARETSDAPVRERLLLKHWHLPFFLVEADKATAERFATGAFNRSQGQASYLQVIWSDEAGKFPWESGYDLRKFPQEQLSEAPPSLH